MFICKELRPSQLGSRSQTSTLLFPGMTQVPSSAATASHICAHAPCMSVGFVHPLLHGSCYITHAHTYAPQETDVCEKPLQHCIAPPSCKKVHNPQQSFCQNLGSFLQKGYMPKCSTICLRFICKQ